MKVTKPTKFIALFDMHVGYEKTYKGGNFVEQDTHCMPALQAAAYFADDFKPDALVLGGDQLNCGPVSHWLKGKPKLVAGFNLKHEMDTLDTILKAFETALPKKGAIKIWHDGNHEAWIYDHVSANPGISGLVEPVNYLKLRERGYEIYSQGEVSQIGKLHFVHGDVVIRSGSTVNPAKTLVGAYRKNIRAGHLHTYSAAIDTTLVDAKDFHSGIIVPSLSTKNPAFIKNNPNTFTQGFLYGYVFPNGDFSDYVVIINKGKCMINGKMYDGNK